MRIEVIFAKNVTDWGRWAASLEYTQLARRRRGNTRA